MHASSYQHTTETPSGKFLQKSAENGLKTTFTGQKQTFLHPKSSGTNQKENCKLYSEKNEEEESSKTSSKKYIENRNEFTAFYTQLFRYLYGTIKVHFPASNHSIYSGSNKYILLRVIRI